MSDFLQYCEAALSLAALYALIALGVGLVFGIMRLVNFAHGELIMLGAYSLVILSSVPWPLAAVGAVVIVTAVALAMERIAFRPLREANPSTLLVASFAISFMLQNVVALVTAARPTAVSVPAFLGNNFNVGGVSVQALSLITTGTAVILVVGLTIFFRRTTVGIQMRAAAEDFRMARLLGVRANQVIAMAFATSGVLAGAVSLLLVAQVGIVTPDMGVQPVLIGFVATVIGGLGSLLGAGLGGVLLGVFTVALQVMLPLDQRSFRSAFLFAIVIVFLVVRPQGLLGVKGDRV